MEIDKNLQKRIMLQLAMASHMDFNMRYTGKRI